VSPNKQYELRLLSPTQQPDATTWGVYRKASAQALYTLSGFFTDKTVYLTNDGEALAVVDDYSEAQAADSLEILSFYHHGAKLRGYRLDELLCSSYNVSSSASHFQWFANCRFQAASSWLIVATYELTTLTFQVESGALVSQVRSALLTPTTCLVYGKVTSVGPNRYEMEVCHRVYGQVPPDGRLQFTSSERLRDYVTVVVANGRQAGKHSLTADWYLNECTYQLERANVAASPRQRLRLRGRRLKNCP
jgi:hypothetical protein